MKKITDLHYLLVVNNYSLGSIISILERLNHFIDAENGNTVDKSIEHETLFFNGIYASFDSEKKCYRYCLEDGVKQVIYDLFKFCGDGPDGLRLYGELNFEIKRPNRDTFKECHLVDFYKKTPDGYEGLTLEEWDNAFYHVANYTQKRIQIFIPEFKFETIDLHKEDRYEHEE